MGYSWGYQDYNTVQSDTQSSGHPRILPDKVHIQNRPDYEEELLRL